MKKYVLIFCMGFLAFPFLCGQENGGVAFDVGILIERGVFDNEAEIRLKSQFLTPDEKLSLEEKNKKGAFGYSAANYFLGFGIGSFIQRDTAGGWIAFGGEMTGYLLFLPWYIAVFDFYSSILSSGPESDSLEDIARKGERMETLIPLVYAGMGMLIAARVFGLIRPWIFSSSWNTTLHSALQDNRVPPISCIPVLRPGSIGLAFSMEL